MPPKKKKLNKKEKPNSSGFVSDIIGWVLIILGAISILAFFSFSYSGSEGNWLGPVFGVFLPEFLHRIFGKIAAFLFSIGIIFWGIWLLRSKIFGRILKFAIGFSALVLITSVMATLRIVEISNPSQAVLMRHGGLLGRFLWDYLVSPIFGNTIAAPLFFCILIIALVFIFAFGLRPSHFLWVKTLLLQIKTWWQNRKNLKNQLPFDEEPPQEKKSPPVHESWDDTHVIHVGKSVPFKKGFGQTFGSGKTFLDASIEKLPDFNLEDDFREDEIEAKERFLVENKDRLSQRERAELRKEIAELRRLREQSEWENERKEGPKIQGVLRGKEDITVFSDTSKSFFVSNEDDFESKKSENLTSEEPLATTSVENLSEFSESIESTSPKNHLTEIPVKEAENYDPYQIPNPKDILPVPPQQMADYSEEELQEIGKMLEVQLENFKVKGRVIGITTGPMITRFEVEPGPGVKVSRFASLQEDLALALKASAIRILAPIPGKSVVGIEIPNRRLQTVYCREILESESFNEGKNDSDKILIVLGKDITGTPFTMNLARAPHILIAGQTGSGKSVCINVLMASILFSKTPEELRLILVDPKVVELKLYEKIPHLMFPVITQPENAVKVLQWACVEMDKRYEILAKARVRNLAGFNQKVLAGELPEEVPLDKREHMPFLVIIIDELADLMMVAGKEVEKSIARIAQKARAVGIHLVLATQRPSVNVITGLIKANLPTRLSFKVASQVDARTVMDRAGAEKLIGRGDMLFRATEDPEPHRIHGAFLSDSEVESLADFCSNQNVANKLHPLSELDQETNNSGEDGEGLGGIDKLDALLFEVALFASNTGKISTSFVQRRFGVGYARASRIVDQMERLGICSANSGSSKPRDVLMTEEEIMNLQRSL